MTNGNTEAIFSSSALGKYTITATYASYSTPSTVTVQLANEVVLSGDFQGSPNGTLLADNSGAFYGVVSLGFGNKGFGLVYKLVRRGSSYTLYDIHEFTSGADGAFPYGAVIAGPNGLLYGTTRNGGDSVCNCGTVYKLTPQGAGYSETILYRFRGGIDGSQPSTRLLAGSYGELFGTTSQGGTSGNGTAFKLTPQGTGYAESVLYSFKGGSDAASPGTLIAGSNGTFYGASGGGTGGLGTVFELAPTGSTYKERVLYRFKVPALGATSDIVRSSSGTLYGTTSGGGNGTGIAYALSPIGSAYRLRILYRFAGGLKDGAGPNALIIGTNGTLYGTTSFGGAAGVGTVFELQASGSNYKESILHSFAGSWQSFSDGATPTASLITNGGGTFYGVTSAGGNYNSGTVFAVKAY